MKKRLFGLSVLLCLILLLVSVFDDARAEEPADKGKVLAKVNGEPVYDAEIMPPGGMPMPSEASEEMKSRMLDTAIVQELLYQEAKRQKLDGSAEFEEEFRQSTLMAEQHKQQMLAAAVQRKKMEEFAKQSPEVTDEDVETFYNANKQAFSRHGEERARTQIRQMLDSQRGFKAFQEWLKERISKAKVDVNGAGISSDLLAASIQTDMEFPVMRPPDEGLQQNVMLAVKDILISAEAAKKGVEKEEIAKDSELVTKLFEGAVITVDGTKIPLKDYPHVLSMVTRAQPEVRLYDPIPGLVRLAVLAKEAEGMDLAEEAVMMPYGVSIDPESQRKRILVHALEKKLGFYERVEVSDEEALQYYEQNKARWKNRPYSSVQKTIVRILSGERQKEKRDEYIAKLRSEAKIELPE